MKSVTFLLLIILGLSTAVDRWPGLKLNDRLFASSNELSTQVERRLLFGPIGPGAFLEICGIILKLAMEAYDLLTWTEGARSSEVRDGFIQVKEQMEAIESKNDQIISLIIDTAIRDEYITTERVIMESLRCYNAYLNMTEPEDVAYWKGEFIKWGGLLRESVSFLFDGMVGRGIIAGDILQAIVTTSLHRYKLPSTYNLFECEDRPKLYC